MTVSTTVLSNFPFQGDLLDENGNITQQWRLFFQGMYTRLGGQNAPSNAALGTVVNSLTDPPGPVIPVIVGASPFTYKAPKRGALVISGGGLTMVEVTRDGVTFYNTGSFRGMFALSINDSIRVKYLTASAPLMTFFPV